MVAIVVVYGLYFTNCKKDSGSSSSTSGSSSQIATAQDAETQDALATKIEQDADTQADAVESSNFHVSEVKSVAANGIGLDIDHPDTTYFPKMITLTYNYADTVNGEYMSQTGQIIITVDTVPVGHKLWWRKHVMRTFNFVGFTVTADSSSFTINGSRTMKRKSWTSTHSADNLKLRVELKDTIYSNITVGITDGTYTGSFTRHVARSRDIVNHYYRLLATNKVWHPAFVSDSITFTGDISGMNLQDSAYLRRITTPLVFTLCPVWPHNLIASGAIMDTEGSRVTTITYTPDGCKTTITGKDAANHAITFSRKINRRFHKWW